MGEVIQVLSRTQRIELSQSGSVRVVTADSRVIGINQGTPGPRGFTGPSGQGASGVVSIPLLVWVMPHDLGFEPAGWMFEDLDGNELEPTSISNITTLVASATWQFPKTGRWAAS